MPTATLTITYNSTDSAVVTAQQTSLYTDDNVYMRCLWFNATSGDRWAGYNTDATSIIPAGSTLLYWRAKYKVYSTNWTTTGFPVPKIWFAEHLSTGVTIADYDLTSTETQFTYPNPDNFPLGSSLSGVSLEELSTLKFGGNRTLTTGNGTLYFDELILEVDYNLPVSNNALFMGEPF